MKKILPDMVMIGLVLAVVLCLAANLSPPFSSPPHALEQPAAPADSASPPPWHPPVSKCGALKGRNLFLATGHDAFPREKGDTPLPREPYLLEAILLGQEKQAIFRRNSGEILALTTGQSLVDGAVLIEICPRSVKLKKGRGIVTMMLFDIQAGQPAAVARVNEQQY